MRLKLTFIFLLALPALSATAQTYLELNEKMISLFQGGNYQEAAKVGLEALNTCEKEYGEVHEEYLFSLQNLAIIYDNLEETDNALKYYDLAIAAYEKVLPNALEEQALQANDAGLVAKKAGLFDKSGLYFIYALNNLKKAELASSKNYAIIFSNLMGVIVDVPDSEEKLGYLLENCENIESDEGVGSESYGLAANDIGLSAMTLGNYDLSADYFNRSLKAYAAIPKNYLIVLENLILLYETSGDYDKQMATKKRYFDTLVRNDLGNLQNNLVTITQLGNHLLRMQDYDSAGYYFSYPIEWYKKDENTLFYATALDIYGDYMMLIGEYKEAVKNFNKAKNLIEKNSETKSVEYGRVLNHLGEVSLLEGNYDEAQLLIPKAVDLLYQNPGPESEDYFSALNNMGNLATALSMFDLAESLYNEALLKSDVLGNNYIVEKLYLNESMLFLKTGRFERAMMDLMDALRIDEELFAENSLQYANYLTCQGTIQHFLGFYEESIISLEHSYKIRFDLIGTDNTLQTQTLLNLGIAQLKNKDLMDAKATLEKSINMQEALRIEQYPDYARTLANLGFVYFYLEDYENAINMSLASIDFDNLDLENLETASTIFNLATYYTATNNYPQAKDAFALTNIAYAFQINTLFPTLSEKDKNDFFYTRKGRDNAFNRFAILVQEEYPDISVDVYNNRLLTKGLLLSSVRRLRKGILNSGDSTSKAQYKYWNQLKEEISQNKENLIPEADYFEKELIANELEKILTKKAEDFLKKDAGSSVRWEQIRDYLKANEVAIEMIRVDDFDFKMNSINDDKVYYVALIISPETNSFPQMVVLENGKDLETKFLKAYQNGIKYKVEDELSYGKFWQPIAEAIDGYDHIERIYLSTDGIYNKISLNTLLNPETNKYILDEVDIRQVINTKDILLNDTETSERINKTALFGFPQYDLNNISLTASQNEFKILKSDTISRFVRNGIVTKLPGTKHEVESIGSLLKKNSVESISYLYENASETQIKALIDPYILHIATHGFFTPDTKKYPWPFDIFENPENNNPFNGSGLLLAGAQNTINGQALGTSENGILTAAEVMNLTLENTELVVLSACETGLGEIKNGEGVYGLQRSFQVAGAKSVIMSLWTVDDTATQKMMTWFYESWLSGQTKREAFRNSQIKLRLEFPEPYYWGAFIIIGE